MKSGRRLYLARHGDIGLPTGQKHFEGQVDLPLSEIGVKQAYLLAEELRGVPLSGVFCSDLVRSRETASIAAEPHHLDPITRKDIREICLGEWDGLTFAEVQRRYPGEFLERGRDIVHFRPPGGESFLECALRVRSALEEILRSIDGDVLIVGHLGVNRVILCDALGMPLENMFRIDQPYGSLSTLRQGESGWRLERLGAA